MLFLFDIIRLGINENADEAWFVLFNNPWSMRGAAYYYGSHAGVFAFGATYVYAYSVHSFRVVLNTIFKRNSKINKKNRKK